MWEFIKIILTVMVAVGIAGVIQLLIIKATVLAGKYFFKVEIPSPFDEDVVIGDKSYFYFGVGMGTIATWLAIKVVAHWFNITADVYLIIALCIIGALLQARSGMIKRHFSFNIGFVISVLVVVAIIYL